MVRFFPFAALDGQMESKTDAKAKQIPALRCRRTNKYKKREANAKARSRFFASLRMTDQSWFRRKP